MSKKKEITIKERIDEIAKNFAIPEDLRSKFMASLISFIERVNSPELFCSKCDQKMNIDLEKGKLYCIYCGYKTTLKTIEFSNNICIPEDSSSKLTNKTISQGKENSNPNPKLLKKIDELSGKRPKGTVVKKGKTIAELAGQSSPVTEEDEQQLAKSVPGISKNTKVNWS